MEKHTQIKIVIGLGNPGEQYKGTRHNIGFEILDKFAENFSLKFSKSAKMKAKIASSTEKCKFILAKPQTFMNLSGLSVVKLLRFYRLSANQVLLIYDDADLNLGNIRIRTAGSAGGHNGIKSIISALGTEKFPRLRVGINKEIDNANFAMKNYVLSKFSQNEKKIYQEVKKKVINALIFLQENDIFKTMTKFNQKNL